MTMTARTADSSVLTALDTNNPTSGKSTRRNIYKPSREVVKMALTARDDICDDESSSDEEILARSNISSNSRRHFQSDDDDSEEEGYLSPLACTDSDVEDGDDGRRSLTLDEAVDLSKKRKDENVQKKPAQKHRRRRRSSARFLRLSGRFGADEENDNSEESGGVNGADGVGQEHLGEMYRQAIRMNAENKINAGNSWGLRLIENIDKFLGDDDEDGERGPEGSASQRRERGTNRDKEKRVNFTKASCTLDASVKIYSYRVDDVHLTSYKVLANLNRTDKGKSNTDDDNDASENLNGASQPSTVGERKQSEKRGMTETLEGNVANLNMSKLDSAYDIDPLFHKMSKTFDEGGAKGLLLANLGVSENGCGIVFDSKEDTVVQEGGKVVGSENTTRNSDDDSSLGVAVAASWNEGHIDISSLSTKMESILSGAIVNSLALVPQLESLRNDHAQLEAEGFVDDKLPKPKSKRYANTEEEEEEAEKSIHREALERSRASLGRTSITNNSFATSVGEDDAGSAHFGSDDFGCGDDDDDDPGFSDFVAMDDNGAQYSSISFTNNTSIDAVSPGKHRTSTSAFLDAMCSSNALSGEGDDYEYFNTAALEKVTLGSNIWAGSAHWKKSDKLRRKNLKQQQKTAKRRARSKKAAKERSFVDLSCTPCLDALLKTTSEKRGKSNLLQLTQASRKKQLGENNLLPPDAGVGIDQLSRLFLRPDATFRPVGRDLKTSRKSVAFQDDEIFPLTGFDDGVNESFGGDGDDGPGFQFANDDEGGFGENDDYVVESLEGVRKVEKIQVGYATVAKKVDVKRLKKDLWAELEAKTSATLPVPAQYNDPQLDHAEDEERTEKSYPPQATEVENSGRVSFKQTVEDMAASQAQADVTVSFYFICCLHLANEKGLRLDSTGLNDFVISVDDGSAPRTGMLPTATAEKKPATVIESDLSGDDDDSDGDYE